MGYNKGTENQEDADNDAYEQEMGWWCTNADRPAAHVVMYEPRAHELCAGTGRETVKKWNWAERRPLSRFVQTGPKRVHRVVRGSGTC